MQTQNTPATDTRYWTALCVASVFGANLGDFVSHDLHMGHWRGLAPLALLLAAILLAERRATRGSEAYYWLAIITVRTAATNLADLVTHDLRLGYGGVVAALAVLLVVVLVAGRASVTDVATTAADVDRARSLPRTGARYWVAMLVAGTLGTTLGDAVAGDLGFGVGWASVILVPVLAAAFAVRAQAGFAWPGYWVTVVAIRTVGTTIGDYTADTLSLPASTAVSGGLFVACLILWPRRRAALAPGPMVGDTLAE